MRVDGVERRATPWKEWAVTTHIDCSEQWEQVWRAVGCHRSQLPEYSKLLELPEAFHQNLWGQSALYRAYSLVNGGRKIETDLFAGLRQNTHGKCAPSGYQDPEVSPGQDLQSD